MDPLSALSVAGTVIQFVDFGSKLLTNGVRLYYSSQGTLKTHEELELVTMDLQSTIMKLRDASSAYSLEPQPSERGHQSLQTFYLEICDAAARVAEELLKRLQRLRVSNGRHRAWESLKTAVKTAWSQDEIVSLTQRLSVLKESMQSRFVLALGYASIYQRNISRA